MELRSIQIVNDYIGFNNKSTDFLIVKLGQYVDINAYLFRQSEIEDKSKIKSIATQYLTVLHTAIEYNNIYAVSWLIENGADVNKKMEVSYGRYIYDKSVDNDQLVPKHGLYMPPLQLTMNKNFLSIAKISIDSGANINCLTNDEQQISWDTR